MIIALLLTWLVNNSGAQDFFAVTGPCNLRFPEDHGPHPGFRTEWWYYTGNLSTETGRRFGFQLTFFRSQTAPPGAEESWPDPPSRWRTLQIYTGHAAVSDISGKKHYVAEEMARGALGMAGAAGADDGARIYLKDWHAELSPKQHRLHASSPDFDINLTLKPEKPPVLHGDAGYSRKGSAPERASCYYSFTRLKTEGTITLKDERFRVTGLSWMDQEYSTALLEPGISGWDWFSLQFSDNAELMVFQLRRTGGGAAAASSGTFISAAGETVHLSETDFSIEATDAWKSPHSGATYPSGWDIAVPGLGLKVALTPNVKDQEMRTQATTGVTYWEGSVSVEGRRENRGITGAGYVEMTGYDRPLDAPL